MHRLHVLQPFWCSSYLYVSLCTEFYATSLNLVGNYSGPCILLLTGAANGQVVVQKCAIFQTLCCVAKRLIVQGNVITSCEDSHVCLQLCTFTLTIVPVWSVRFSHFECTILLHHQRFSGNLHVITIQLAIVFVYIASVQIVYSCVACRKNVQHGISNIQHH